jgi:hypothetical protein
MREYRALSNPTQTAMKGLRETDEISPCRTAARDIFEIEFGVFCN